MRIKKFFGLNIEIILRLLFLLGFSMFFYNVINTGKVQYYVHPRTIPYMKFTILVFIIISLFLFSEIFKPRRKSSKLSRHIIFLIPLLVAFLSPPKTMVSPSIPLDNMSVNNRVEENPPAKPIDAKQVGGDFIEIREEDELVDNVAENSRLKFKEDTILVDNDSFIPWLDELYIHRGKHEGEKIEIVGFIFKESGFKQNEFVIARLMMVCCAADMQPVGLLCKYDRASELELDSWVKVNGIIKYEEINGDKIPVIEVESLEDVDKPENEFLYPY